MAAAEMDTQQQRELTLKDVPRTSVRILCLDAVMMEKLLLKELEKKANVMKTKNVKLASLAAVLMEGKEKFICSVLILYSVS